MKAPRSKWDIFISHASEDKEKVARPLADWLEREYGFRVWLDEFALKAGDSLRRSIDHGLANSSFGIVIISKHFMAKRWPQDELAALATKEAGGKKVILPIWHDVTASEVRDWSPLIADEVALRWTNTPHVMVKSLVKAMDLPFSRKTLSGLWQGETGRLRLLYEGMDYTPFEFYEGDYDWNGRDYSGQMDGVFSTRSRVLLFEWSWSHGPHQGIGFLTPDAKGERLVGGWKLSGDQLRLRGYRPFADALINESDFVGFAEPLLAELKQFGNSWSFTRLQARSKKP